jgi:hypothetical protein
MKHQPNNFNRIRAGFKRTVKSEIEESGIRIVELKIEFLEKHPTATLPRPELGRSNTIDVMRECIDEHIELLKSC